MSHEATNWVALIDAATELVVPEERDRAVLYVLQDVQPQGRAFELGGTPLSRPYDAVVFFVDLEPGVNWDHRCRYLVMDVTGANREAIDARRPPFLRSVPRSLRLVWKGAAAPAWAVVTQTHVDAR